MTSEDFEISNRAICILVEKIAGDPEIPEELKEQIFTAIRSKDSSQIAGLRELAKEWIENNENN